MKILGLPIEYAFAGAIGVFVMLIVASYKRRKHIKTKGRTDVWTSKGVGFALNVLLVAIPAAVAFYAYVFISVFQFLKELFG